MTRFLEYIANPALADALRASSARHGHLCPRQVLGVRAAQAGTRHLGISVPRHDKKLLVIAEIDGCFLDGIDAVTGANIGHRTLRVEDYGKIAAVFVNAGTGEAVRVAPRENIREIALDHAPHESRSYFAMLVGYQIMPQEELFNIVPVRLSTPPDKLISRARFKAICAGCGEEIFNERQKETAGEILCAACFGSSYYQELLAEREFSGG